MSVLPIYNCFHPILKKKTGKVAEIDDKIRKLVENMYDTLYKADGIGLAGNQVGENLSIIIIDVSSAKNPEQRYPPITLINPVITNFSDETIDIQEGCLSIPKLYEDVTRPRGIQIKFYDLNMKEYNMEANGMLARVMQHEVDHLNGILFTDRISPMKRVLAKSKLKKIMKGQTLGDYPMVLPNGKLIEP